MIKILFICHGNICRSPMAEFVLRDMVQKRGMADQFQIASAATSTEEIGNPPHRGTRGVLSRLGISTYGKYAVQMTKRDYNKYDYIIGMDSMNIRNIYRIIGDDPEEKVYRMLDFTEEPGDVDDPWYTGKFDLTYEKIRRGCEGLLEKVTSV